MNSKFILDSSVSAAWCFSDERNAYTEGVLNVLERDGGAVAPALWVLELANVLVIAERRSRISASQREEFLTAMADLDVEIAFQSPGRVFVEPIQLAIKYKLSVYDAVYLALAIARQLPLATQDEALLRAARQTGVAVFVP